MAKRFANYLVCAAAEEELRKVLLHFADVIEKKCGVAGEHDKLKSLGSVEDLYQALARRIEDNAAASFGVTAAEPVGKATGYRYFGSEFIDDIAAGHTAASGLFVVMGDSLRVFRLCFETVEELPRENVDEFFGGLEAGSYGAALLQANGDDHFRNIKFFCGKPESGVGLFGCKNPYLTELYPCKELDTLMNVTCGGAEWLYENGMGDFGPEVDEQYEEGLEVEEFEDFDNMGMAETPFDMQWEDIPIGCVDTIAASVAAIRWPYYRDGLYWSEGGKKLAAKLVDLDLPEYAYSQYSECVTDVTPK